MEPRALITAEHVVLARNVAKKLVRKHCLSVSRDDAVGAAYLALVEAASNYDPSRGAKFAGHAFRRIRGALLDQSYADRGGYRRGTTRVYPPMTIDVDRASVSNSDVFVDASAGPHEVAALRERLSALSDRERLVLQRYLVDGKLLREIGAELGITECRVWQIVQAVRDKLGRAQ